MRKVITLLCIIFGLQAYAQEGARNFIDQNYIEVTGTAQREIIPDLIFIRVTVSDKDPDIPLPLEKTETEIKARLTGIGVNLEKEFFVEDISGWGRRYAFKKDQYESVISYRVIVHSAKVANALFREMEEMNINKVDLEGFSHTEIEKLRLETKVEAVKAARHKAELLAVAAGQGIGKTLMVQEMEPGAPLENFPGRSQNVLLENVRSQASGYESVKSDIETPFKKLYLSATFLLRIELK